jgi:hypothetical protein
LLNSWEFFICFLHVGHSHGHLWVFKRISREKIKLQFSMQDKWRSFPYLTQVLFSLIVSMLNFYELFLKSFIQLIHIFPFLLFTSSFLFHSLSHLRSHKELTIEKNKNNKNSHRSYFFLMSSRKEKKINIIRGRWCTFSRITIKYTCKGIFVYIYRGKTICIVKVGHLYMFKFFCASDPFSSYI